VTGVGLVSLAGGQRPAVRIKVNPAALRSWLLASSAAACSGPSKLPLAWFELAAAMAARNWSKPMPYAASAAGLTRMRTAGRWPPARLTRPTPVTCAIFGAIAVSTISCRRVSGRVSERTARVRMGASAGMTLL